MQEFEIKSTASSITSLFDKFYEVKVENIPSLIKKNKEAVVVALEWLSRENKIFYFTEEVSEDYDLKVCLIE